MRRRRFLATLALAAAPSVLAQARKPVKIGILFPSPQSRIPGTWSAALLSALEEFGYREGAGLTLEYRDWGSNVEALPKLARELIAAKCDLMFALGPELPARALQDARSPAPIVFVAVDYDPIERGLVRSLRQPDRNTTGVYVPQNALVAKRFEVLREVVPKARNFLVMSDVHSRDQVAAARTAAEASGVRLTLVEFHQPPYDFQGAFETARKAKVQGVVQLASPGFHLRRDEISELLLKHRLPAVGSNVQQAEAGYLLTVGPDINKTTQRAARIAVRIFKGAKPAEIPVEQADEVDLTINAKTAKALGMKMPESVLARATRIVQ
jgi:putative ABC transport system substrate-binding protein